MNRGLSSELKLAFPNVVPVIRSVVIDQKIKDPHWLAGFTAAEGCFYVNITKSNNKIGERVQLIFQLTQHRRDEHFIKSLINYLNCGHIVKTRTWVYFHVLKFNDIIKIIIPFFKKYKIKGVKAKDFADWCLVAEMMNEKKHLTKEGLHLIRKIKARMNTGRKID